MKRKIALVGAGAAALSAGMVQASAMDAPVVAPTVAEAVILSDTAAEGATATDPHMISPAAKKTGFAIGIGGLIAGIAGMIGWNGVINWLARNGQAAARVAGKAAAVPAKAVKSAAIATAKAAAKPGKAVLGVSAVALALVISLAVLDLQWKAGLIVGAGVTFAGLVGYGRAKRAIFAGKSAETAPQPA